MDLHIWYMLLILLRHVHEVIENMADDNGGAFNLFEIKTLNSPLILFINLMAISLILAVFLRASQFIGFVST